MGVQYDAGRRKFVVRWREDGWQCTRRFATDDEATAFDASIQRNGRGRPPARDYGA
jgi:hypothetical protein